VNYFIFQCGMYGNIHRISLAILTSHQSQFPYPLLAQLNFLCYEGHDSIVVSLPNSQSGSPGFNPWQCCTCTGLTKPAILLGSANWYQFQLGSKDLCP